MKLKVGLLVTCIVLVLADLALHRHSHFGEHGVDGSLGFYALMSLFGCVAGIIVAKIIGVLICVEDDYYDHA